MKKQSNKKKCIRLNGILNVLDILSTFGSGQSIKLVLGLFTNGFYTQPDYDRVGSAGCVLDCEHLVVIDIYLFGAFLSLEAMVQEN